MRRVALATCAELPALDEDDGLLVPALAERDIEATPAVWDDPHVDWAGFELIVLRSTWDYAERCDEFLAWARSLPRVLNPVPVLEWTTDKERYLTDLGAAGVPIVPSRFIPPGHALPLLEAPFVVKPAISAGGRMSALFEPNDRDAALELLARIHREGRTAMVQPYLADIDETALVFIDGRYSHALRRHVPLPRSRERAVFFLDEHLEPRSTTPAERALAEAALACAPDRLLYGRVDLLGHAVLELELAEPSLYLSFGEGAVDRFAQAIVAVVNRGHA